MSKLRGQPCTWSIGSHPAVVRLYPGKGVPVAPGITIRLRLNSTPTALPRRRRPHDHTGRVSYRWAGGLLSPPYTTLAR
eukprot:4273891-Prymnesium_polylepis.1